MNITEKAKTVVAGFLNCAPENISDQTKIDRDSLRSSIMVHRLYATLQSDGIIVEDYSMIKTFGELMNNIQSDNSRENSGPQNFTFRDNNPFAVGIDIEQLSKFPDVADYREDEFYKQNFTSREIAYCILKTNPKESFAGLFAAKEALVKADQSLQSRQFSAIEINHHENGKPIFEGFSISISHVDQLAVAIAVKPMTGFDSNLPIKPSISEVHSGKLSFIFRILIYVALVLSIASFLVVILKNNS